MTLEVSRNSWHAKVYSWWYERKFGHELYTQPNLCPYMRAVLFWGWMRWLFLDGRVGRLRVPVIAWVTLAVEIPRWAGMFSYVLKEGILFAYMILAGIAVAILAEYFVAQGLKKVELPNLEFKAGKTFLHLLKVYAGVAHSRICPELTLVKEEHE